MEDWPMNIWEKVLDINKHYSTANNFLIVSNAGKSP